MSSLSESLPAPSYPYNPYQYQSPSIDYSMTIYEISLCDDPLEEEVWDQPSSWSSAQFYGMYSRQDSFSSFDTLDSELEDEDDDGDDIPQNYSNLWEIQLELGEIPDMISNNLLKPCPLSNSTQHASYISQFCKDAETTGLESKVAEGLEKEDEEKKKEEEAYDNDDDEEGEEDLVWPSEVSIESGPPVQSEKLWYIFGRKTEPTTGVYQEQEYGDGQSEEDDEEDEEDEEVVVRYEKDEKEKRDNKWGAAMNHPVYGMLSCSLEFGESEFRHDRKDSGVFMHGDRDCYMEERPSPVEEDMKAFPAAVERRETCTNQSQKRRLSAAYRSLQRIASSFSSLSS
ncbi:hypothetical protein BGZ49_006593 [Haplosporangium sp. Z 27]|nr:hypothetical protein BGZ49_006593 [Haplosporangium sp. Z 27]